MNAPLARRLFGTDGVRGKANIDPMTPETAVRLGRAAAHIFRNGHARHRIVIGKDTRLSGYMLESALTAGICSMGVDVLLVGPLPTPGIAAVTRSLRADAGIVISASHNPFEDNGIKFFSRDGFKLPGRDGAPDRGAGRRRRARPPPGNRTEVGKAFPRGRRHRPVHRVREERRPPRNDIRRPHGRRRLRQRRGLQVSPTVLRELGATVITMNDRPDGVNINADCGSLHPEGIREAVRAHGADMGIAHDGDADRAIFADETGRTVDGDQVMAMCALDLHAEGKLRRNTLVATVMSNLGLDLAMRRAGIKIEKTPVGDRYVVDAMRRGDFNLGGEQSGHIVFLDDNTTGDGIVTALHVLTLMKKSGKPLSALASAMTVLPQVMINIPVRDKPEIDSIPSVAQAIREAEGRLWGADGSSSATPAPSRSPGSWWKARARTRSGPWRETSETA